MFLARMFFLNGQDFGFTEWTLQQSNSQMGLRKSQNERMNFSLNFPFIEDFSLAIFDSRRVNRWLDSGGPGSPRFKAQPWHPQADWGHHAAWYGMVGVTCAMLQTPGVFPCRMVINPVVSRG